MGLSRNLNETVTYWRVSGDTGFGGNTFAKPILLKARWSESQEKFINQSGEEDVSLATVHIACDVIIGDWIALGDHTRDPEPTSLTDVTARAYRVRGFSRIPNLRSSENNRRAFI